jgi:hypothetical protein
VVVELAGDERIGGVGVDWRPIATEVVDRAKNHVIVVNGSEKVYENIGRLNASPPRETARPPARASA